MASGKFFAPVEHGLDDDLVHGFINGGIGNEDDDDFDFSAGSKYASVNPAHDLDFGPGRRKQTRQGSKGSLRGGGGRHVKFDLGKTSFIDPNPFFELDALMGGSNSDESSLDFSGGGRISNCDSNPSYRWSPGQKTPQGLGFCPDDFRPGHVMKSYDGEYRVGVDRNGKKGWVPNSVPVHQYSNWDINLLRWPHHGINHALCCGNGVPQGVTVAATPATTPEDKVKAAQVAAEQAKKEAETAQAALLKAQADAKTAADKAAADQAAADAAKATSDAAAAEKMTKATAIANALKVALTDIENAIVTKSASDFTTAVEKLKKVDTDIDGGELVGGDTMQELKTKVQTLVKQETKVRTTVVKVIENELDFNEALSASFPTIYSDIVKAINVLAEAVSLKLIRDDVKRSLQTAFEKAKAKQTSKAAATAALDEANTAIGAVEINLSTQTQAEADAKVTAAKKANVPAKGTIENEKLQNQVIQLLQAATSAKDAVTTYYQNQSNTAAADVKQKNNAAFEMSIKAVLANGHALKEGVNDLDDAKIIEYLKEVATVCKQSAQSACKTVFERDLISQLKSMFTCTSADSEKVQSMCKIADELAQILGAPASTNTSAAADGTGTTQRQPVRGRSGRSSS